MTADWPSVPLGTLVEGDRGITYGVVQPGAEVDSGVPIVRVSDVRDGRISADNPLRISHQIESKYTRTRLRGGELLLTIVGTVGETAIVPQTLAGWNIARAIAMIPIRSEFSAYWVQIALRGPVVRSMINSRLNTTVQATLNLRDVAQLPILLPPKHDRERISECLGNLDRKVELNRQMNETLEALLRELFQDWFVDYGPTRAKEAGGPPYLKPELWSLFPDRLDDANKPYGWKRGKLGDLAEALTRSINPSEVKPTTPYVGLEHIPRRSIALREWAQAGHVTSGKNHFCTGEFLFGKLRPYFHKVVVAPMDGIASTDIVVCRELNRMAKSYVLAVISSEEFVTYTDRTSTGTKMPRTSWSSMAQYELLIPPWNIMSAFDDVMKPILAQISDNVHESKTLVYVRDMLLPKLMSGEIRLDDAEKVVEAVL